MAIKVKLEGVFTKNDNNDAVIVLPISLENTVNEGVTHTYKIAVSTTDLQIPLGGVSSGKIILIKPSAEISIKLDDTGNTSIPIDQLFFLITTATPVTALYVTNVSATIVVTVEIMVFE